MGHSKTSITVAAFTATETVLIYNDSDPCLGGRDLDWSLLEYLCDKFTDEKGWSKNPKNEKKSVARMLDAAEKLRSALTGDNEATLEIDNFYEGDDLEEEVTLQEFEQSIAS